jgi:PAS domain-containing protein
MGLFKKTELKKAKGDKIYTKSFLRTDAGLCLLTHPDFEVFDTNDSFASIFGFEREDLKGSLFAVVWKKCEERDLFFNEIIRNGHSSPKATRVLGPDDYGRDVVISGVRLDEDMILITVF